MFMSDATWDGERAQKWRDAIEELDLAQKKYRIGIELHAPRVVKAAQALRLELAEQIEAEAAEACRPEA